MRDNRYRTVDEISESKTDINSLLKQKGYQDKPMDREEAYLVGTVALYGLGNDELSDAFDISQDQATVQSTAAMSTFHNMAKYESESAHEQIAGISAAVMDYDIKNFLDPDVEVAMDNCGTGGDTFRTMNVSTVAAMTASADSQYDINMCKHGSPGNTDSTGSSDFVENLGFELEPNLENVERGLQETGFAYTDALDPQFKDIHRQTHQAAKIAHMNDIIGPLTNPLDPEIHSKRVIGVNHLMSPETVAKSYRTLNEMEVTSMDNMMAVRGFVTEDRDGGIDEISTMEGGSQVAELKPSGSICTYELNAGDFGLPTTNYRDINPENRGMPKAEFSEAIADGSIGGGARDLVAANAALLYNLEAGMSLEEGTERAKQVLDQGIPVENARKSAGISRVEKID